jgi:septal ring-binding cell division protein DamX
MTAPTETPPATTPELDTAPEERRCPRCGHNLRPDQEWCLNCGSGVGAQLAAPRGWRWPVALVAGLLALTLIAFVLALVELAGDAETVGTATPTPQPQAQATPAPTSTAAPSTTSDPSQIPPASGGTAATPQVSDWPAGKTGYTVILESASSRAAADARAKDLAGQNIPVGVLDTSGYASLTPDRYVVFSGQYTTREEARVAARGLAGRVDGARVGRVAPA